MKERHAVWDGIAGGFPIDPSLLSPAKREALHRFNLAVMAERTGWTLDYIESLDANVYDDILTIYNVIDAKRNSASNPTPHGR